LNKKEEEEKEEEEEEEEEEEGRREDKGECSIGHIRHLKLLQIHIFLLPCLLF